MSGLGSRLDRLEGRAGSDHPFAHLTEEQIAARVAELSDRLVAAVEAGIDTFEGFSASMQERIVDNVHQRRQGACHSTHD